MEAEVQTEMRIGFSFNGIRPRPTQRPTSTARHDDRRRVEAPRLHGIAGVGEARHV